jgi:AcrR family transcriptional regulator
MPATDRTERREQRREALLDAAIEVVRVEGPGVSMDQIAQACGITKPVVYRHFGDREGLVTAMALRFVAELIGELAPQLASDAPPQELLRSTIDSYLQLIERDTNLYRFLSTNEPGKRDLLAGLIAEEVAAVLERLMIDAGADTTAARPYAYGLVGMVQFAGDWWTQSRTPERTVLVEQIMTLLWSGFEGLGFGAAISTATKPKRSAAPAYEEEHR